VSAGGLVPTLEGPGPFTVFAPTNDAFAALPAGVLAKLLKPENKKQLDDILTYHVVAGAAVLSKDLTNGEVIKTVEGKSVTAKVGPAGVFINNAKVTAADNKASNGVVHIINAVLLPPAMFAGQEKNIVELAESVPSLSTLVTAVSAGGLVPTLEGPGPFTVFAPTNDAFAALPAGVLAKLLKPENKKQLDDILTYHVVAGAAVLSKDLTNGEVIKTVEGKSVTAKVGPAGVFINNAKVTAADNKASNGVVHIINAVLLPPTL